LIALWIFAGVLNHSFRAQGSSTKSADLWTVFFLGGFLHLNILAFPVLAFEQIAFPVTAILAILSGWLLMNDVKKQNWGYAILVVSSHFCLISYTPNLANVGLIAAMFLLVSIKKRRVLPFVLSIVLGFGLLLQLDRQDVGPRVFSEATTLSIGEFFDVLKGLFLPRVGQWLISPLAWVCLFCAFRASTVRKYWWLIAWAIATFAVAVMSDGYFRSDVFHRSIRGAAPWFVLFFLGSLELKRLSEKFKVPKSIISVGLAVWITAGLLFVVFNLWNKEALKIETYFYVFQRSARLQVPVFKSVRENYPEVRRLIVDPDYEKTFSVNRLADGFDYFLPDWQLVSQRFDCTSLTDKALFLTAKKLGCPEGSVTEESITSTEGQVSYLYIRRTDPVEF